MGSIANSPRLGAFTSDVHKKGLDLRRSVINVDLGVYEAANAAVIRAGQFVARDASGYIVPSAGADTFGVAKWNKQQLGVSVKVDEAIVLNGTTATNLSRANVSNVSVRSAPNFGGSLYTGGGGDYNANTTNGTIARDATTTIPDGATVYVTYTYALTDADFEFDGRDWRNNANNDVAGQENRIAVITDWSMLFSMEYDSSVAYALTGSTSKLYVSAEGRATSTSGTDFAGKVMQLPTAEDPFMGMTLHGNPVA